MTRRGEEKRCRMVQTEPSEAWGTRRRTKVRREAKFDHSKKEQIRKSLPKQTFLQIADKTTTMVEFKKYSNFPFCDLRFFLPSKIVLRFEIL